MIAIDNYRQLKNAEGEEEKSSPGKINSQYSVQP